MRAEVLRACLVVALGLLSAAPAQAWDSIQNFSLAARAADASFVRRMPELGLDERSRDGLKNNLVMLAIREDGEVLALALLDRPVWQNKSVLEHENQLGETALMLAAIKGAKRAASRLIDLGAEVNRAGWTPLHYAASGGQIELVELLLERNAYVDAASPNGTTPLMMAARFNHQRVAEALIRAGADPTLTNQSGLTARDYANESNNGRLATWLERSEIQFTNRYLESLPKVDSRLDLEQTVRAVGGSVKHAVVDEGAVDPAAGVEVFDRIQ